MHSRFLGDVEMCHVQPSEDAYESDGWLSTAPPAEFIEVGSPQIDVETVPRCPVCKGDKSEEHAVGFDYEYRTCRNPWRFVRCIDCGHVWLNPRPATSTLGIIYPSEYYAYHYESRINSIAVKAKEWLDRGKLRTIVEATTGPIGRYLDIGCGTGRFLRLMHQQGLSRENIWGIELDDQVVSELTDQGYHALNCRVEDCHEIELASLDLVTMFHVIEHVDDPGQVIERIASWLAPGGLLALETPNIDSQDARKYGSSFWGGYHIPRHWNLFTPETLTRLCSDRGLEPIAIRYQTGHSFWMYSIHHRLRYGQPPRRRLSRLFDPFRSVGLLAAFTLYDKVRAALGRRTSAMLLIARRQPA